MSAEELLKQGEAQGNRVRELKAAKASKEAILAEVEKLKAIKEEYKKVTGQEFPSSAPSDADKKKAKEAEKQAAAQKQATAQKEAAADKPANPDRAAAKAAKKAEKEAEKAEKERRRKEREEAAAAKAAEDDAKSKDNFGNLPLIQSSTRTYAVYDTVELLNADKAGQTVRIRGRVHTVRATGGKVFIRLRQRIHSLQVLFASDLCSKSLIKFATKLNPESIVDIQGVLVKAPAPIESCSQHDIEVQGTAVFVVSEAIPRLPIQIDDASLPEGHPNQISQELRLDYRVLDLRTEANQAIFRIQSAVGGLFREFLTQNGFIEIHSPKIISAASESGASVFKLGYFETQAYLAQSPQLYKQMALAADMERVFEIGPVFRAENSNTHRHLTEFVGMDFEMTFIEHYHEVMDVMDRMFVHIFRGLSTKFAKEIETVYKQNNREPFKWLEPSLRLTWPDAIAMLRDAGVQIGDFDDIGTAEEKLLGRLVKEKYDTDFYILDKFPLCIRPFYTMPDAHNQAYSNSYDLMMRGEEIMSGAQRIHDPALLEERAKAHGLNLDEIKAYLEAFKFGCPPHAGGGVGLERVVMLFLGLPNIRRTSLFPRDPKRITP